MTKTRVTCDICGKPANMKLGGDWDDIDEAAEVDDKWFVPQLAVDDICLDCHAKINALIYQLYKKHRRNKHAR